MASPALTGTPTAPTATTGTNTTQIATTAFVTSQGFAPLASPALTGTPTATTATSATSNTQIATTAFVAGARSNTYYSNITLVSSALGTPISGTLTNCTAYPAANLSGTLAVTRGGTGTNTATGTGNVVLSAAPTLTGLVSVTTNASLLLDCVSTNETGIFLRQGFTTNNKYNASILCYDHNSDTFADGLSLNGYDGVSVCTGSNDRQERMRVTSAGNVGIGSTNPAYKLDVAGNINSSATISAITLTGTLSTAAQPFITSIGMLSTLQVVGCISATNMGMFRNRIINGDARVDQRNSAGTPVTTSGTYAMDRFQLAFNLASGSVSLSQSAMPAALSGFQKCIKVVGTNAVSGAAAGTYVQVVQNIEGNNISDLAFGTASAQFCTMSFWVYGSAAGATYSISLRNGTNNRTFVHMYTITVANTWQQVSFVVPGDTTGAWAVDNTTGLSVQFTFGCGGTYYTTTANAWQTGTFMSTNSTSSLNSATIYITGVQFEKGTFATPFEFRPLAIELQLCQRYFHQLGGVQNSLIGSGFVRTTTLFLFYYNLPVQMRTAVAPTLAGSGTLSISHGGNDSASSGLSAPGGWVANAQFGYYGLAASGLTLGSGGQCAVGSAAACFVQFNAEL